MHADPEREREREREKESERERERKFFHGDTHHRGDVHTVGGGRKPRYRRDKDSSKPTRSNGATKQI